MKSFPEGTMKSVRPRENTFRWSGKVMILLLPGFSSLGLGAIYGLSNHFHLFTGISIIPVSFMNSMWNFNSTGGVFGGGAFDDSDSFGVIPVASDSFGYEFSYTEFMLNVDLGIFIHSSPSPSPP